MLTHVSLHYPATHVKECPKKSFVTGWGLSVPDSYIKLDSFHYVGVGIYYYIIGVIAVFSWNNYVINIQFKIDFLWSHLKRCHTALCKWQRINPPAFANSVDPEQLVWRSQLIWIYAVCYSVYEFISTIWIKESDWLKIWKGFGFLIYSAGQVLTSSAQSLVRVCCAGGKWGKGVC